MGVPVETADVEKKTTGVRTYSVKVIANLETVKKGDGAAQSIVGWVYGVSAKGGGRARSRVCTEDSFCAERG